jgi:hypothetical protein
MLSLLVTISQAPEAEPEMEPVTAEYGDDSDDDLMDPEFERRALNKREKRPRNYLNTIMNRYLQTNRHFTFWNSST